MTPGFCSVIGQFMVTPLPLTGVQRALLILPLCLSISIVYKATRLQRMRDLPIASGTLWLTIVTGMYAVGIGLWLLYSLMA